MKSPIKQIDHRADLVQVRAYIHDYPIAEGATSATALKECEHFLGTIKDHRYIMAALLEGYAVIPSEHSPLFTFEKCFESPTKESNNYENTDQT